MRVMILAIAMASCSMPAFAARDDNAYGAIVQRDYVAAERALVADRKIFPKAPELMLNLAVVYQQTGRTADARTLYYSVLAVPDVSMELSADRTASSHAIARTGLRKLDGVQLSAR